MASTHPVCTGLARLAALALVCGAAACAHAPGAAKSDSISPQSSDPHAPLKGPGVEYKLIDLGVPSQTLDFVGTESTALAGAKASGDIFFGNVTDTALEVYQRSLKSGERTYVTQLKPYQNGSLSATPDGKRLVYCRFRELKDVIDDPTVTYPQKIAVPYVFDVAKQEEQRLFDFGKPEFRQWRASGCMPSISPDGKSVYVLVYDMDRVVLHNQAKEWLDRDKHLLAHDPKQSAEDRKSEQDLVDGYITAQSTRILLKNEGVTVDPAKPATDAVRAAMRKFFDDTATPHAALLINEDGKSRVLPLQGEANSEADYRFIAATGNHTLIVAAQQLGGSLFSEEPLYLVDQQTGKLQKFGSFTGLSKLVTLSSDEHELLICYNPFDAATKQIVTHTYLRHIPLDGSKPVEADLLGDYLGNVVDLDSSATHLAGQELKDHKVYIVDIAAGKRQLISEQIDELNGLFLSADAKQLVCFDKGITYLFDVAGAPDKRKDWVSEANFASAKTSMLNFLKQAGFSLPASGLEWHWEQQQGFGSNEITASITDPAKPDAPAFLRYDVSANQVVALWFPGAYSFPIATELQGQNYDYYDAEKLAKALLDRVGWISPVSRTLYQPGPNPVYDKKSDSYVITFRSGYNLKSAGTQIVFNNEATLRIGAKSGQLLEMNLLASPEIQNQPLTTQRKDLDFIARNVKDQAIPEYAPMKVDSQNARLLIYPKHEQGFKGAVYTGSVRNRLAWEVDVISEPEHDLYFTYIIDTETGEVLGSLSYAQMAPSATRVER